MTIAPELHVRLQQALDSYEQRTRRSRPSYQAMAEAAKAEGVETGASAPTIQRHVRDPAQRPIPELVAALARVLEVREAWLFEGDPAGEMTEEMQKRTEQVREMKGKLRQLVSERHELHPAAEALVIEIAERWMNLPEYCYRTRQRPTLDEVRDQIREIIVGVVRAIPRPGRGEGSEDDLGSFERGHWNAFTVSLLKAVWDGLPPTAPVQGGRIVIDETDEGMLIAEHRPLRELHQKEEN